MQGLKSPRSFALSYCHLPIIRVRKVFNDYFFNFKADMRKNK